METTELQNAFQNLMGINGDIYIKEIENTGKLSESSYEKIKDNIQFNGMNSIVNYFGIVHWYYLQGKK